MSRRRIYETPAAFRRGLTDRLRLLANATAWPLAQLQRQFAYDRLLERLYLVNNAWIVKGATALVARGLGVRATIDVDVYRELTRDVAEAELREAASHDIGDWFRFELGPGNLMADGGAGVRIPVTAFIAATVWAEFHVDLVGADLRMTGQPEDVPPLARVAMPAVEQHGYRAYPLADHVADKVAAIIEQHGPMGEPSTRFKDLVDLVAIVTEASVEVGPQMTALGSEAARRGLTLPNRFGVPDRRVWERGYAYEANRALLPVAPTLDDALAVVSPFLDPLLDHTANGRWDPRRRSWTGRLQSITTTVYRRERRP